MSTINDSVATRNYTAIEAANATITKGAVQQHAQSVKDATASNLASAVQGGNAKEAKRVASDILRYLPAARDGSADRLGPLGSNVRSMGLSHPVLRDVFIQQPRAVRPRNAEAGNELNMTVQERKAAAGMLAAPLASRYDVPDGSSPASLKAYSDWSTDQALQSEQLATQLRTPFAQGKNPQDDPVAWEIYTARSAAAGSDRVRAQAAIAAELRAVYQGDPKNQAATEEAAGAIAARMKPAGGDQQALLASITQSALKTVLDETPEQRHTNTRLYEVHRAGDKLDGLMADRQAGRAVADQDIVAARNAFAAAREHLMRAVGHELDGEIPQITVNQAANKDARAVAAERIARRHPSDSELHVALNAQVILRIATAAQGPEQQMKLLGELTPRSLDPTIRAFVFSDARGAAIVDRYVDWAAGQVTDAYSQAAKTYEGLHQKDYFLKLARGTPPALAATEKLLALTDPHTRPYVKPEIAASIFKSLRTSADHHPSTMERIIGDLTRKGEWHSVLLGKDNPMGARHAPHPTYHQVVRNISVAMDHMGRAQDAGSGKYDSPLIEQEVSYLGRQFAEHIGQLVPKPSVPGQPGPSPLASWFDPGFKQAATEGSVILALETAKQLSVPGAKFAKPLYPDWNPRTQANVTLQFVQQGIQSLELNTKELFTRTNRNMAPLSAPIARFGVNMTEAQIRQGVDRILSDPVKGKKLYETLLTDRKELDLRGGQLIRLGETVGFYQQSLEGLTQFANVQKARNELLDSQESTSAVMLSNTATLAIGTRTARKMIDADLTRGLLEPQRYNWISQAMDFSEFVAETYILQKPNPQHPDYSWRTTVPADDPSKYGTWGQTTSRRIPRWGMPPDVVGEQRLYSPADIKGTATAYEATRLGRTPLGGLAVWGIGGGFQVALTDYLYEEVGLDASEQWRKPLLVGLVGGFAAFHLVEAGAAAIRVGPHTWRNLQDSGALQSLESKAPLLYRKADWLLNRDQEWMRFSISGTKPLIGTLASLMAVATVWDVSGVVYRAQDSSDPSQGAWGSKWWKVGTHGVNALSDTVLLRLQVTEFAKRAGWTKLLAADAAIMRYSGLNALGSQAAKASAGTATARTAAARWLGRVLLLDNPLGVWVNLGYLGTTGVNWLVDQKRYVADLEHFDNAFLQGAGVGKMQAELLKDHAFFSGDGRGDGFALGYHAVGGDPASFVEYLNKQTDRNKLEGAILAAGELPQHLQDPSEWPELPSADDYYLSLPVKMNQQIAASDQRFTFNEQRQRFEDRLTQMYFDAGRWIYFGPAGTQPQENQLVSYDPATHTAVKSDGKRNWEEEIRVAGLKQNDPNAPYLALPDGIPANLDPNRFPTIHYNERKQRYEDSATGLYYAPTQQAWRQDDSAADPRLGTHYYYPQHVLSIHAKAPGFKDATPRYPTGVAGWEAYLKANNMMPPTRNSTARAE